jgi:hypothetical protein
LLDNLSWKLWLGCFNHIARNMNSKDISLPDPSAWITYHTTWWDYNLVAEQGSADWRYINISWLILPSSIRVRHRTTLLVPDKKMWQSKGQKFRLLLNKGQKRWRELENAFQCHIYALMVSFSMLLAVFYYYCFFFLSIIRGLMTRFHNTDSSSFFLV